jgi:PmbA protein
MTQSLEELSAAALKAAAQAGADCADAIAIGHTSLSIEMRAGVLEHAERAEGIDIGLRVFVGRRFANVSISDRSQRAIAAMAERAVAMAREAPEDPHAGLADPDQFCATPDAAALELCDPTPEPDPQALADAAQTAEAAALGNPAISQVQSAGAAYGSSQVHLATSNGFSAGYRRSDNSLFCVAIAGTGSEMERDHDADGRIFQSDLRSPAEIGAQAAARAAARIGARKPPSGRFPVIFDERVAATLLGHLLGAVNGAAIARGGSFLRDAIGRQILPPGLDIFENPHRPRVTGSRPFDGEGLATRSRHIVKDGILQGWTLDLARARKLGMRSTANAARGASAPPSPMNWNVSLSQGDQSRDALLRDMGTGLLVTSLIGSTINPNTGDYSRGAAGHWIEHGEIAYPVNECTIAGSLIEMFKSMVPANDARPHLSRPVPSILIPRMTLAGA